MEVGAATRTYAEKKRNDRGTQEACQAQQMGFEPIVDKTLEGCELGTRQLLKNLCQQCDKVLNKSDGSTKSFLKGRISIVIPYDISHILEHFGWSKSLRARKPRFIHECSG